MLQHFSHAKTPRLAQHLIATVVCVATALIAGPIAEHVDLANVVMLFLLAVFLVALRFGRSPALTAAFLSVGLFDFLFVSPHYSFAVDDIQYVITFAVMLTVALITGQLGARLGLQAEEALERERRTRALYEMASQLAGSFNLPQVEAITQSFLRQVAGMEARFWLPDAKGELQAVEGAQTTYSSLLPARQAFKRGEPVHRMGISGQGPIDIFLPLKAPLQIRGVIAVTTDQAALQQERALLDAVANLAAIAIERLHYAEVAQTTEIAMAGERLRNSVLASLSHDLRTPLTAMVGLADTLVMAGDELSNSGRHTAQVLRDQAMEMAGMVNDLLDLARFSSGGMVLHKEWQPVEEVIGAAIQRLGPVLTHHPISVELAPDLPLLEFDATLLERVIGNLIDNASKYTPTDTPISITVGIEGDAAHIRICDRGPGFPPGIDLNTPLVRNAPDAGERGVGLGLTICKVIVEAHNGTLALEGRPGGSGGCAHFTLPLGTPPAIDDEALEQPH